MPKMAIVLWSVAFACAVASLILSLRTLMKRKNEADKMTRVIEPRRTTKTPWIVLLVVMLFSLLVLVAVERGLNPMIFWTWIMGKGRR
jgi:hypothetical protein